MATYFSLMAASALHKNQGPALAGTPVYSTGGSKIPDT